MIFRDTKIIVIILHIHNYLKELTMRITFTFVLLFIVLPWENVCNNLIKISYKFKKRYLKEVRVKEGGYFLLKI